MCAPKWLALREDADATARSPELADLLRSHLRPAGPVVVRDLGAGTGSMLRWLAPRLPGPQHWVLHDRDPVLLADAAVRAPVDGVSVEVAPGDLTALRATDLVGTSVVTASALLDLLTGAELDGLAAACVAAGCATLLTLTVAGRVVLDPADPLDQVIAAAFDAHQRRTVDGRRLLGPDAGAAAVAAFDVRGVTTQSRTSPWRLGAEHRGLIEEWLRGWVGAACAQQPGLDHAADAYLHRRLAAAAAGALRVEVGHVDVLALPAGAG